MPRAGRDRDPRLATAVWVMASMTGAVDRYELHGNAASATFVSEIEIDETETQHCRKRARRRSSDTEQVLAFIDWMFDGDLHNPWCPACRHDGNDGWMLEWHLGSRIPITDVSMILDRLLDPCPAHDVNRFRAAGRVWHFVDGAWAIATPPGTEDKPCEE